MTANEQYALLPHDKNGKLDLENGDYDKTKNETLQVKYKKEIRMENDEGTKIGVIAKLFNYTEGNRLSQALILSYGGTAPTGPRSKVLVFTAYWKLTLKYAAGHQS
jgi:hypothetical protein